MAHAPAARAAEPTVILLSLDGVRHDYPERVGTPALDRLARTGARASRLVPVFPSNTFPGHVSLATGTYPDEHGIVNNSFYDRERGHFKRSNDASWIEAEPLWVTAERQGVRAAVFFWVGSETDWNGIGASFRQVPFDSRIGEREKVDQILAWLDLPESDRPRLILSWWHGTDGTGHRRGPESSAIGSALAKQDAQLVRLLEGVDARGMWESTTLLLVSDHGMTTLRHSVNVVGPLASRGIRVRPVPAGGAAFLFLEEPGRRGEALQILNGIEGVRAYPSDALPEGLRVGHPKRSGDVVALTDPPRTFYTLSRTASVLSFFSRLFGATRGGHGYDPQHPDMGAVFYAAGRGVPAGLELGSMRAIDVAPTVTRLLGIDPPRDSEGEPIPGIGSRSRR